MSLSYLKFAGGAQSKANRRKPAVCASRASARYAVVSKRRARCLPGSSPLESPDKVRGIEEFKDNFRIELEDYELQREEKEMEKEKEREEVEVEGELPFRVSKPPFYNQQGFICTCCLSTNNYKAYPFCVCCSVKVS
jgi:hypothetical protein